ncbi:hypothetical protein KP509_24G076100 [Ceratopteris richardii]|nr:hypothetical protein KP509_24G076100 [Ceratopteris richardii]
MARMLLLAKSLLMILLMVCLLQEQTTAHRIGSPFLQSAARKEVADIIAQPCNGAICPLVYYDTDYVICGDQKLPAYSNCCVLYSCLPDITDCHLVLQNDEGIVDCSSSKI